MQLLIGETEIGVKSSFLQDRWPQRFNINSYWEATHGAPSDPEHWRQANPSGAVTSKLSQLPPLCSFKAQLYTLISILMTDFTPVGLDSGAHPVLVKVRPSPPGFPPEPNRYCVKIRTQDQLQPHLALLEDYVKTCPVESFEGVAFELLGVIDVASGYGAALPLVVLRWVQSRPEVQAIDQDSPLLAIPIVYLCYSGLTPRKNLADDERQTL
ncbi:hypothetical protein B0H19DRAFT_1234410 [Mycena capillaripes]|nr:hypothetical protein B0H19DRAFT_1234410 [Mycena capillaripes]